MKPRIATERDIEIFNMSEKQLFTELKDKLVFVRSFTTPKTKKKRRKKLFNCINRKCNWYGNKEYCVTFKHNTDYLLCPECHEHVEEVPSMAQKPPQGTNEQARTSANT